MRNRNYEELVALAVDELAASSEYWTGRLQGSYALVQAVATRSAAGSLSFNIKEAGVEARGARLLSQQDPLNRKDKPIARYASNPELVAAARSVAKLSFARNGLMYSCTGFMVSDDLLLTNHHCVSTAPVCGSAVAIFGYEYGTDRKLRYGEEFRCLEVVDSDFGLDLALLKLAGLPGAATRWGHLVFESGAPAKNDKLYLIQYPDGEPKRVARDGCLVSSPDAVANIAGDLTDFGHTCDTISGSSGSPVLDMQYKVVGLHHKGFDLDDMRWQRENRAVKGKRVRARIASAIEEGT